MAEELQEARIAKATQRREVVAVLIARKAVKRERIDVRLKREFSRLDTIIMVEREVLRKLREEREAEAVA